MPHFYRCITSSKHYSIPIKKLNKNFSFFKPFFDSCYKFVASLIDFINVSIKCVFGNCDDSKILYILSCIIPHVIEKETSDKEVELMFLKK